MLGLSFVKVAKTAPEIKPNTILSNLAQSSKILDEDGKTIEEIASEEYREIISYDSIPRYLIDAFVSVEDERFWKHKGIDVKGVFVSAMDNFRAGGIVRGGSTITQQLVKNIYLSPEVKWERKIKEMYLALKVDNEIPKERILEGYLNRVYLGQHAFGIASASQIYFSKPVDKLSIAEAATIAGIVKSPSSYSLFNTYYPKDLPENANVLGEFNVTGETFVAVLNEKAFERKNYVLQKMRETGSIDDDQYEQAIKEDVSQAVKPGSKKNNDFSNAISYAIKNEAIDLLMKKKGISKEEARTMLYTGGLRIKTSIDWQMQKELEKTYDKFTELMSMYNKGSNPLLADLSLDKYKNIINNKKEVIYFQRDNLLTDNNSLKLNKNNYKVLENGDIEFTTERIKTDGKTVYVSSFYNINDNNNLVTYRAGSLAIPSEYIEKDEGFNFTVKKGFFDKHKDFYTINKSTMIISSKYFTVEDKGTIQPQSSTVVIDQKTGQVKAMVASRGDSKDDTIDRATNFTRPPASSIKPLAVYAPALENGYTLASVLDDSPMLDRQKNTLWPLNVYKGFRGLVSIRESLADSINTTAVKLYKKVGMKTSMKYLEGFGLINKDNPEKDNFITNKENPYTNDENLSFAIGSTVRGFTVRQMAEAYSALANEGVRNESSLILSIESDKEGEIFNGDIGSNRVVSRETSWLLTDVMREKVSEDRSKRVNIVNGIEIAAKTGTSDNNKDFWIAGYTPYYTTATWVGFDNNSISMSGNSHNIYTLYNEINNGIHKGMKKKTFKMPDTIVKEKIDSKSGLLPNKYTYRDPRGSMAVEEYFAENTLPTETSTAHVLLKVDRRNNLLAPSNAPRYFTVNRVFQKREEPLDLSIFDDVELPEGWTRRNLVPKDWQYEAPTRYSTLKTHSVTTTKTLPDGTISKKTVRPDGSIYEVLTYPDGRVISIYTSPTGKVTKKNLKPKKPEPEKDPEEKPEEKPDSDKNTPIGQPIPKPEPVPPTTQPDNDDDDD